MGRPPCLNVLASESGSDVIHEQQHLPPRCGSRTQVGTRRGDEASDKVLGEENITAATPNAR